MGGETEHIKIRNIEIHLMQFTTGTHHKSTSEAVIPLNFPGSYDSDFKTHIAIIGDYLVVLLAHEISSNVHHTLYLVDWVRGYVMDVRITPTSSELFFEILNVSCRKDALAIIHISRS